MRALFASTVGFLRALGPPRALRAARLVSLAGAACLVGAACTDATTPATPDATPRASAGLDGGPGSGDASAGRKPGTLRVGTFNVRRFFDTVCDTGRCGSGDFEAQATPAEFELATDRIVKGIAVMDPDVIALEEVETQVCLEALKTKLMAAGLDYPVAHLGEIGAPGSVDVAVLARGSLTGIKTHREIPITRPDGSSTTFSRELLEVRMTFGARPVVMFAAHFRSKVDDDAGRRLAEATAARAIVLATAAELPSALVLLGGDLNDAPGSPPIDALEEGGALLRVASDLAPGDQGTYVFQGVNSAIDHIFVTREQAARYVPKSAAVYREARGGFAGSDHAALAADFSTE